MNVEQKMLERMRVHGDIRTVGIFITDEGKQWVQVSVLTEKASLSSLIQISPGTNRTPT